MEEGQDARLDAKQDPRCIVLTLAPNPNPPCCLSLSYIPRTV